METTLHPNSVLGSAVIDVFPNVVVASDIEPDERGDFKTEIRFNECRLDVWVTGSIDNGYALQTAVDLGDGLRLNLEQIVAAIQTELERHAALKGISIDAELAVKPIWLR